MLYGVFSLAAAASLYQRVLLGKPDQTLPWYGAPLALYGLGMALASRDPRCKVVYGAFGVVVAAAFTRGFFPLHARAVGVIEVCCCLLLLACLTSLSRHPGFRSPDAVLRSGTSKPS